MKKVLVSFVVICTLVISCFSNAYLVKADECPWTDDGNHVWDCNSTGYLSNQGWTEYAGFDCTKTRYFKRTCYYCDYTEWITVLPSQHEWNKWEVWDDSTYFNTGEIGRECANCNAYQTKQLKKKKIPKRIKKASKAVVKYFKAAKKYNVKKLNKCFYKKDYIENYPKNKKVAKIIRKRNKRKLKWKLVGVSGMGSKYELKYKVTVPDLGRAAYKASYEAHEFAEEFGYSKKKKIRKFVKYSKKNKNKTVTGSVKFTVLRTRKGWKIYKKTTNIMIAATGFYNEGDFWGEDHAPYHLWNEQNYKPDYIYKYVFGR